MAAGSMCKAITTLLEEVLLQSSAFIVTTIFQFMAIPREVHSIGKWNYDLSISYVTQITIAMLL
jgi:hypothetical protein